MDFGVRRRGRGTGKVDPVEKDRSRPSCARLHIQWIHVLQRGGNDMQVYRTIRCHFSLLNSITKTSHIDNSGLGRVRFHRRELTTSAYY